MKPFYNLLKWRDTTWKMVQLEYVVDSWIGPSMEMSCKHDVHVPESIYNEDDRRSLIERIGYLSTEAIDEQKLMIEAL